MPVTFELKSKMPFESMLLDKLCDVAEELLKNADKKQYTQAIVLYTDNINGYGVLVENALSEEKADEKSLLDLMKSNNDTRVSNLICIWQEGFFDLPSHSFREMLCELNPENEKAGIAFPDKDGYQVRILKYTM